MLAAAIIVFRECLEAALVVGIVLAAARDVAGRGRMVSLGVALGVLGALVVALFSEQIAAAMSGMGQELMNATILLAAVVLLGWHNVWMTRHGREMTAQLKRVSSEVLQGQRPLYALAVVVGLAVLREGSETVLFLYGVVSATQSPSSVLAGGVIGLCGGVAAGAAIYAGLLRLSTRHLFTATGLLILLLASGMAAQSALYLAQAGILPTLTPMLWDTSAIIPRDHILGQVLHVLMGYDDRPSGIQVLFFAVTFVTLGGLMLTLGRAPKRVPAAA
jgi:high-affinity iron transporter